MLHRGGTNEFNLSFNAALGLHEIAIRGVLEILQRNEPTPTPARSII